MIKIYKNILSIAFLLAVLFLVNFYQWKIYDFYSFLPHNFIPLVSAIIIFAILLSVYTQEYEGDKLKNEFLTIITHKFRTPLTGIKWAVDMLQKDTTFTQRQDFLMEIGRANQKVLEIVDMLANFAKLDQGFSFAYEAVSIREIIEESLRKYADLVRDKKISFDIDASRSIPLTIIDKSKIQFVIDVLFDNAIKYTPENGKIALFAKDDGYSLTLIIEDSGIGITWFDRKRIFSRFWRGTEAKKIDPEGMGIALYTARKIIESHHGKIWVKSKGKNKGAAFFVKIPKRQ